MNHIDTVFFLRSLRRQGCSIQVERSAFHGIGHLMETRRRIKDSPLVLFDNVGDFSRVRRCATQLS